MNTYDKSTIIWSVIGAVVVGGLIGYFIGVGNKTDLSTSGDTEKQVALYNNMRKLWSDHVIWTREYMIAVLENSDRASEVANRLMKNQEDIGNAAAGYYGRQAGDQLTSLLKQHISVAVDLVAAAKSNDKVKFNEASKLWQDNADQIAGLLSQANPNWPKSTLSDMMNKHLETTSDELDALLDKDYKRGVVAFDDVFDHMMKMSDTLSSGIIKQFPDKFN